MEGPQPVSTPQSMRLQSQQNSGMIGGETEARVHVGMSYKHMHIGIIGIS